MPTAPSEVSTNGAINISETSVTLQGSLTKLGSLPIVQHGFCGSTTNAIPTINDKTKTVDLGALAQEKPFSYNLTGLTKGTNYYVRAYILSAGEPPVYGFTKEVITKESGLILYYPFNGDAADVSGNGYDAESKAMLTEDRFGNTKRACDISQGGINVGDVTIGNFQGDVTYSFWVKLASSAFSGSKKILMGKEYPVCFEDVNYYNGFILNVDPLIDTKVHFYIQGLEGKNANPGIYDQAELVDKWHMITIVKAANDVRFYLDGRFIISKNTAITADALDHYSFGGRQQYGLKFDGRVRNGCNYERTNSIIDEVRVYRAALNDVQVAELYKR